MKRCCLLAGIILFLSSCLLLETRRVQNLYIRSDYTELIKHAELVLDSIAVRKGFDSQHLEADAEYIIRLLLARNSQELRQPGKLLKLRALIKEKEFSRNFQNRNTVTVELSVLEPISSEPVAIVLFSENTKETIESYAYLHSLINRALRRLTR
jgi:hypothetical protein